MRYKRLLHLLALLLLVSTAADASRSTRIMDGDALAISKEEIASIKKNPKSLLLKFVTGGPKMVQYISRAVQMDPSVVDSLLSVANTGTFPQSAAMGAGFARAARTIGKQKPEVAADIRQKVLQSKNKRLRITFLAIGPDFRSVQAPILPDRIAPLSLIYEYIGENIPLDEARLGIRDRTPLVLQNNALDPNSEALTRDEGTLAAVVIDNTNTSVGAAPITQITPPTPPSPLPPDVVIVDPPPLVDVVTPPPPSTSSSSGSGSNSGSSGSSGSGSGSGSGSSSGSTSPTI